MNLFEELKWRGLIYDCTNIEELEKKCNEEKITLYAGFDPTADSLHLGNLIPITMLMRFQKAGHHVLPLVGGSTGMIGDPGGRNDERNLQTIDIILKNAEGIKKVLSQFITFDDKSKLVNNYDWTKDMNVLDYLRDVGKHFNINYMLSKDSVKSRLETGISYTEFSYMILQALDFKHLYEKENCILQIGGQDQWGNITAGFEFIRKTHGENKVFGLTVPLLLKSDGTKFGKSAAGSLWLNKDKTTSYEIYQYFLNVSDDMVVKLLKYYTFLTKEEIENIENSVQSEPHLRKGQKVLAKEVVKLIHGEEELNNAIRITEALFNGDIKSLSGNEIENAFKDVPSVEIEKDTNILELLIEVGASSSKREAREFVSNGAVTVNDDKIIDLEYIVTKENAISNRYIVVRRGKKNYYLIKFK